MERFSAGRGAARRAEGPVSAFPAGREGLAHRERSSAGAGAARHGGSRQGFPISLADALASPPPQEPVMTPLSLRRHRPIALLSRALYRAGAPLRHLARRWRAWRQDAHDLAQIELLDAHALRDLGLGFSVSHALRTAGTCAPKTGA
jgi:hypothetical protein